MHLGQYTIHGIDGTYMMIGSAAGKAIGSEEKAYQISNGVLRRMRLAALYSGGKDSTLATLLMEDQGHEVPLLLSILPGDPESMLFHTPNIELVEFIAGSMRKTLLSETSGEGEELNALSKLLTVARKDGIEGIVTGAIQSDYQFIRIDRLCSDEGLKCFSPLWRKDQGMVLSMIVESGIRAVVVATAAEGLGKQHLGRPVDSAFIEEVSKLHSRLGVNPCGEGGEYETYTLDSPLHRESLEIKEFSVEEKGHSSVMHIRKIEKRKKF